MLPWAPQAEGAGPVKSWPAALMVWLDRTQEPGLFTASSTVIRPPSDMLISVIPAGLNDEVAWRGGMKWGLTQLGMTTWTAAKTARVMAIAGRVRRISTPAVTPEREGERGVADGAMPRAANRAGEG